MDTCTEILPILRNYFQLGFKAIEANRIAFKAEGNEPTSDRTGSNWFRHFKEW